MAIAEKFKVHCYGYFVLLTSVSYLLFLSLHRICTGQGPFLPWSCSKILTDLVQGYWQRAPGKIFVCHKQTSDLLSHQYLFGIKDAHKWPLKQSMYNFLIPVLDHVSTCFNIARLTRLTNVWFLTFSPIWLHRNPRIDGVHTILKEVCRRFWISCMAGLTKWQFSTWQGLLVMTPSH